MKSLVLIFRLILLAGMQSVLASCSIQQPTPVPTMDSNPLRTEVAKTVIAEIKQITAAAPTATLIPPTRTNTAQPPVVTTTFTPTAVPPTVVPSTATATLIPTITKPPVSFVPSNTPARSDVALLISQRPGDGTTMSAGVDFDTVWKVKNVGRKNWTTAYYIKYQGGDNFATNNLYMLKSAVNTGEEVDLIVDCIAPRQPGSYLMRWVLVNDNAEAFYTISIRIAVK